MQAALGDVPHATHQQSVAVGVPLVYEALTERLCGDTAGSAWRAACMRCFIHAHNLLLPLLCNVQDLHKCIGQGCSFALLSEWVQTSRACTYSMSSMHAHFDGNIAGIVLRSCAAQRPCVRVWQGDK